MKGFRLSERNTKLVFSIIALIVSMLFLFPLYWIVVNSLKSDVEIFQTPPTLWPKVLHFESYVVQVIGEYSILRSFLNSCLIAFSSTALSMLLAVPAAYGLARFRIRGKKVSIMVFLITQMMPVTLVLTPLFIIYKNMGLYNNYLAPIISDSTIAVPFVILTLRTYFIGLPREVEESAKMDGCNVLSAFVKIMLPMAKPGIIMSGAFSFLFAWSDLAFSLTFLSDEVKRPMTAGIYNFIGKYGIQWNKVMAFAAVIVLPVIIIFVTLQKYIVGGLTSGAVKE